ncbi:hypothetical protein NXW86_29770 [Bacteroides thetaiotaomicron]|uniref:hypothetical protein n=1 Tax=Bacteroides thetaiotaomicron TaxID=818 RepID=UPI0021668F46|nr:hypothetical protein [Bacteroides thetaiotaomicron]MCS2453155.1 hypothetical protein [Bacteroides thetaiotaomicron]
MESSKVSMPEIMMYCMIFSYVGMNTQDIKVNNQRFISVTMKDDVASLDEVVVVGYEYSKNVEGITVLISTVSGQELLKAPTMNTISNRSWRTYCRAMGSRSVQWSAGV